MEYVGENPSQDRGVTGAIDQHFRYVTHLGRLNGILEGRFTEDWPGECFMLLGAVYGAGGC